MKKEIDMINGKVLPQMLRFAIPIMLSSVLQTLYNSADSLIVGRSDAPNALGAVGSAGPIINIILNLIMGFAVGTNVIVARYMGAGDKEKVRRTSDTGIIIALVNGIFTAVLGLLIARPVAELVKIDPEIMDMTVLYLRIYFLGLPFTALYNFAAATLRGIGNTKGPMLCLIVSGSVNVVFNIIFVMFCGMDVDGVATATVISQIVAAVMVIYMLKKSEVGFSFAKLGFEKNILKNTIKIGVPAGIQGMVFSISNTIIISAVNSFGAAAASANTVAGQVDAIIYVIINAVTQTAITFSSQNIGARKTERLHSIFANGLLISLTASIVLSAISYIFKDAIIEIFAPGNAEVKEFAIIKFNYVIIPSFTVAFMEIATGMLRGMNKTFISMLMCILGVCGFRIAWLMWIFPMHRTFDFIYLSYPISWVATGAINIIAYLYAKKHLCDAMAKGKEKFVM